MQGCAKANPHVWMTLTAGSFKSGREYLAALRAAEPKPRGCLISETALALLLAPEFKAAAQLGAIELFNVCCADLGFERPLFGGGGYAKLCGRARKFGLQLCPPEVGPLLRLHYVPRALDETLNVAMQPIADRHNHVHIFQIVGKSELGARRWPDNVSWYPAQRLIFTGTN